MKKALVFLITIMMTLCISVTALASGSTLPDDFWQDNPEQTGAIVTKTDAGYEIGTIEGAGYFVGSSQKYKINNIKITFKMEVIGAEGVDQWINIGFAAQGTEAGIKPGILIRKVKNRDDKATLSCSPENNNTLINAIALFDFNAVHTLEFKQGVNDNGDKKYFMYLDGNKMVAGNKSSGVEDFVTEGITQEGITDSASVSIGAQNGGIRITNVTITDGNDIVEAPASKPQTTNPGTTSSVSTPVATGNNGTSSVTNSSSPITSTDSSSQSNVDESDPYGYDDYKNNNKTSSSGKNDSESSKTSATTIIMLIIIGVLVLAIAGGLCYYFLILKKKTAVSDKSIETTESNPKDAKPSKDDRK